MTSEIPDERYFDDLEPVDETLPTPDVPENAAVVRPDEAEPFAGLSHGEVLDLRFDDQPAELVQDTIPRGVIVAVSGVPETYKGWVCIQTSTIVAAGEGELFGRPARTQGPVGYFWQDDSTRNEAERIQLFARVRGTPRDLPIRWFLNEGAILPDDLERAAGDDRTPRVRHGRARLGLQLHAGARPQGP